MGTRADKIDEAVTEMVRGKKPDAPPLPANPPKTAWDKAGMTREEWSRGQNQNAVERARAGQSNPGN